MNRDVRFDTRAVHGGMESVRESGSHVPVIDLSTTNPLPDVRTGGDSYENLAGGGSRGADDSPVYQRLWNDGVARFEHSLAGLEGTDSAAAFSTGMAALTATLTAITAAGDADIVAIRPLYGGTDHVLDSGLLGTRVTWATPETVGRHISPTTALVVCETPANPTLDVVDIGSVVRQAGSVPVLVDNTFATPVLQRPREQGATLVLHSATKFLGGHGDVMGGIIAGPEPWIRRIRHVRALTGALLHPSAAYQLHRGLRTLPIRVRAQQENARRLVDVLRQHPAVATLHYPGLASDGDVVARQMSGSGSVFALDLAGGFSAACRFVDAVSIACHAVSLGGVDTLVQHPASLTHRPVAATARPGDGIVRVSVGLEDVRDLEQDLTRALDQAEGSADSVRSTRTG
ncbi:PLP-dependent aspartate aminotransferase family protein [Microbacterium sp. MPKO10]|uniref:trans-sulfuration enzyme family protein n=1 Tax=Microbacterium sp. MPKO10 TaxID=2989818 RepID=UPI0022363A29|nr:PLP-dependent aspartate aminotransferase family protein [Microbacterium sp. MPKO10]MCW4458294.1 PLP-dependent aspartate aminotransferase family protein [Microbacterium sp. MPKO10]